MLISLGQGPADYFPGKFVTIVSLISGLQVGAVVQNLGLVCQGLSREVCASRVSESLLVLIKSASS